MQTEKEYWDARQVPDAGSPLRKLARRLKSSPAGLALLSFFLSSRNADEYFLQKILRRYSPDSALDVACGRGKPVLPANIREVYGVDITGFPQQVAEQTGYKRAVAYHPPDYDFVLDTQVDLVTCINLNAHVPFESLERILSKTLHYLKDSGVLVLFAEVDNLGLSYSWFSDPEKKRALVDGMEHYHFETRSDFLKKLLDAFPGLRLIEERSLNTIVGMRQHYVYHTGKEPGRFMSGLLLLGDILTGPVDSVYTWLRPNCESFLATYVFKKETDLSR